MYTIITSLNKKYWDDTSQVNVKSWDTLLGPEAQIVIYTEDQIDTSMLSDRVIVRDLYTHAPELVKFKDKHKDNPHYNGQIGRKLEGSSKAFKWNAIKFAHKTFAIFSEMKLQDSGWLIWLDADVLMHQPVDKEYLEYLCPPDKSISYLGRPEAYDECGLMGYNLDSDVAVEFLEKFEAEYVNGLDHLRETHDSWVFFQLRLAYEDQTPFHNLNPTPKDNKSPFNNSGINERMIHTKGKSKDRLQQKFLKRFKLAARREERANA